MLWPSTDAIFVMVLQFCAACSRSNPVHHKPLHLTLLHPVFVLLLQLCPLHMALLHLSVGHSHHCSQLQLMEKSGCNGWWPCCHVFQGMGHLWLWVATKCKICHHTGRETSDTRLHDVDPNPEVIGRVKPGRMGSLFHESPRRAIPKSEKDIDKQTRKQLRSHFSVDGSVLQPPTPSPVNRSSGEDQRAVWVGRRRRSRKVFLSLSMEDGSSSR